MQQQIINYQAPILVTGAHRTGTTWVGKMLAVSPQLAYISEPLNVLHRPGVMRTPVPHWYTYISSDNEAEYLPAFHELLQFYYHPWAEFRSLHSRKDLLRMGRDWSIFIRGRWLHQRVLLKDPFAVFSIPWFSQRLGCLVIITIRHPAAFASSLVRLGWSFDFSNLLEQPLLMRDYLEPYRAEMEKMTASLQDIIGQASLLWKIVYAVVSQLKYSQIQYQIVRHEDFSRNPVECYRNLYITQGLNFTSQVEKKILNTSNSENPKELSRNKVHTVHLDSQANLSNWKHRLTPEEIQRVRELTAGVADEYYSDQDWD